MHIVTVNNHASVDHSEPICAESSFRVVFEHELDGAPRATQDGQVPMLVWIRDITQGFRPFHSLVRLTVLDGIDMTLLQPFQVLFATHIEATPGIRGVDLDIFNDELGVLLDFSRILTRQFIDDVVKRGPQIVDHITNNQRKDNRQLWPAIQPQNLSVLIGKNVVLAVQPEGADQVIRFGEMTVGPCEPQRCAVKGM